MKALRDTANKESHKIGRNDPCFCGSGKKYKKCCLAANTNEENQDDDLQIFQNDQKCFQEKFDSKGQSVTFGTAEELGTEKMSEVIVEFLEELLEIVEDYTAQENIIFFGIAAWNIAIMSEYEGKPLKSYMKDFPPFEEAQKNPGFKKALTTLFRALVRRKHEKYAHVNRFIVDFKITKKKKDDFHLTVISTDVPSAMEERKKRVS